MSIVLIRTQEHGGSVEECGVGAEVGVSKVGTGHHLTTAIALEPQITSVFPNHTQEIPNSIIPLNIPFPIPKELSS